MSRGLFTQYCIDTCAILDLHGRKFPRDLYPDLWPSFEQAVSQGVIVSIREVYHELRARDDDVMAWASAHAEMFENPDEAQLLELERIANAHPECLDLLKRKSVHADPWVIAAGSAWGLTVVTSEGLDSPRKIPAICRAEGIPCIDLLDLFRGMSWTFATHHPPPAA